jgi:DNA-binding CsgD family transcriptional regulator
VGNAGGDSGPGLRGRRSECETLEQLLRATRAGESRVLVVRGEAGVGKTALLEFLAANASGCDVVRAAGVESEMELAFAGLQQLCIPLQDRIDRLPEPQEEALGSAFGLIAGKSPDRLLVGLAALSLLAEASENRPLICLIDDAQWLDHASAQTLAFVARRLLAERVALVFALRQPSGEHELAGLPELVVRGLGDEDARALLDSVLIGQMDASVRDRVVGEAHGNPLALLEFPRGLTPAELAGGFGLPNSLGLASQIEQSFARRLEPLSAQTRQLLLMAAVEPVGDPTLLWRAAASLGIAADAAASAEAAGLVEIGSRVRFRHPLVRSAVRRAAGVGDVEAVHRALAEQTDPDQDPDRRAWHLACAAVRPDEVVAAELERSACRAQARGGVAAMAAFLERATELTPDPIRRGERGLDAAQAKFDAGASTAALELIATAELSPLDAVHRARLERLRARLAFVRTRGNDAPRLLLAASRRLEPLDTALARETYLEALGASIFAGGLGDDQQLREMAEAVRRAGPSPQPPTAIDLLLEGLASRFTDGYDAGVAPLRRALDEFAHADDQRDELLRWLWLLSPISHDVWEDETWHQLTARAVSFARATGAVTFLPVALSYRAGVEVQAGQFAAASALIEEAEAVNEATGNTPLRYASLVLAAWRGQEASVRELRAYSIRDARTRGEGRAIAWAEYATAVLNNGTGSYATALAAAQRACEHDDLGLLNWALPELVEASVRSGRVDLAATALRRLEERTRAGETGWARGIQARSRALVSDAADSDGLYREAIDHLADSRLGLHRARAQLLYGEWLRRENRRVDAREQLRAAHAMFNRIGSDGFAERARRELLATGETVRKRRAETLDELTAQEAQVARLARDGQTNPEIGAQLFISPRTVEWHLRKVFSKLGVSSRKDLRQALSDAAGQPRRG